MAITRSRSNGIVVFVLVLIASSAARAQILPPGTTPTRLSTGFVFTESPLYDHHGGVYFEDMHPSGQVATNPSHIVRYDIATGVASVVDSSSGGANGLYYNANGQIVSCDRERRQISLRSAGNVAVVQQPLTASYNGTAFNGPNDLVVDSTGGIYFSDPDYENRHALPEAVYYLSAQGALTRIITGFTHPNGVILSPDGKTFYLAVEGQKFIEAYDVVSPGVITNGRLFARDDVNAQGQTIPGITNGPDGLTIDPAGNIYAAVQNAVWAWNPQGQQLFELSFPEDPTNLDFGGADGRTLFAAAGMSLYSLQLNIVPEPPGIVLVAAGAVIVVIASQIGGRRRKRNQHVARRRLNAAAPWSLRFDPAKTTVQLTPFQTGVFKGGYGVRKSGACDVAAQGLSCVPPKGQCLDVRPRHHCRPIRSDSRCGQRTRNHANQDCRKNCVGRKYCSGDPETSRTTEFGASPGSCPRWPRTLCLFDVRGAQAVSARFQRFGAATGRTPGVCGRERAWPERAVSPAHLRNVFRPAGRGEWQAAAPVPSQSCWLGRRQISSKLIDSRARRRIFCTLTYDLLALASGSNTRGLVSRMNGCPTCFQK
jgi:gluconolactonase